MRFFGLKSCDTCRKALKALQSAGFVPAVIDVRADGIGSEDRAAILAEFGDAALNKASTTWRGLTEDEKQADPAELLARYPTLMKRPAINYNGSWTIGWKSEVQAHYLGE